MESGEEPESKHRRKESRRYISLPILKYLQLEESWPGIESATKVIRKIIVKGCESEEASYFITSHYCHLANMKIGIRNHWHIESRPHWKLDISFEKDACRAHLKNEAEHLSLLRGITMEYLKQDKKNKMGVRCKRKLAG